MDQVIAEQTIRRIMRSAGFKDFKEDEDEQLVFSAPDNLLGKPVSAKYIQFARGKAKELEAAVPGARTRLDVVDQWVTISVTLPAQAKKTPSQLDREIAAVLEKPRIGYGLSAIDEDEWSWSVERLHPGQTTWGIGSDTLAEGVEYTKSEAVANIKKALASLGVDMKDAVRLPF